MPIAARYAHTNLIARDGRSLARFYTEAFGCAPVPPERDYAGAELEARTGIAGATLRGVHLRLPGRGERGPTVEIFSYGAVGQVVAVAIATGARVTWCYVTDPEGNAIELQSWEKR